MTSYFPSVEQCLAHGILELCQDRVFASSLCALSLSWVLGRSIDMYWTIPEIKQTGGWIYGVSRVIEETASGFSWG